MSVGSVRPSSLLVNDSGRQSPFRRQNSSSPATTVRATTPTASSPSKGPSPFSPTKTSSLSPEKTSPFVRRPSQINQNHTSERPSSPFARPSSSLGVPTSPSRHASNTSRNGALEVETPPQSPSRRPSATSTASTAVMREMPSPSPSPAPSPFDGAGFADTAVARPTLRPTAQRTVTSSTTSTIKAPIFQPSSATKPTTNHSNPIISNKITHNGGYNHVPQPLLRSMRESFEVLDSSNTGTITSASVTAMLEQMGMDNSSSTLRGFFPPSSQNQSLNLARYLDTLSGPLGDLSQPDELIAAFEAFDVDDSGQIDVGELKRALLETAPEDGERLGEREVDSILGEFGGRRAFGGKGVNVAKGRGEVFRWREFMAGINGGSGGNGDGGAVAA